MLPGLLAQVRTDCHLQHRRITLDSAGFTLADNPGFRPKLSDRVVIGVNVAFAEQQADITPNPPVEPNYRPFFIVASIFFIAPVAPRSFATVGRNFFMPPTSSNVSSKMSVKACT